MEQVESTSVPTSRVLDFLRDPRRRLSAKRAVRPSANRWCITSPSRVMFAPNRLAEIKPSCGCGELWAQVALGAIGYAVVRVIMILTGLSASDFRQIGVGFLHLAARESYVSCSARSGRFQLASPSDSTAPGAHRSTAGADCRFRSRHRGVSVVMLVLNSYGRSLGFGSIVLLLLRHAVVHSVQRNRGAMAIPTAFERSRERFGIRGWERWRKLILPGIFPFLVTGMITAPEARGMSASSPEYAHLKATVYSTVGIGAMISAAPTPEFQSPSRPAPSLAGRVYDTAYSGGGSNRLAESRFKLES